MEEGDSVAKVVQDEQNEVRKNMRESFRKMLEKRCGEMSSSEMEKLKSQGNSTERVSEMIVEELVALFNNTVCKNCKTKFRSIFYNLKHGNNLFRQILFGEVLAFELVRMTATEMMYANQEEKEDLNSFKNADLVRPAEAMDTVNLAETMKEDSGEEKEDSGEEKEDSGEEKEDSGEEKEDSGEEKEDTSDNIEDETSQRDSKEVRQSPIDLGQELPSTSVGTPNLTDESVREDEVGEPFIQRTLKMESRGRELKVNIHCVSPEATKIKPTLFPEDPMSVVGILNPDPCFNYIDKKNKRELEGMVMTFLLTPVTVADRFGYMDVFTFLSSKGKVGVIESLCPCIKVVYLIPLDKQDSVPACLLPFSGPGLPNDRTMAYLLAVVIKSTKIVASGKRKLPDSGGPDEGVKNEQKEAKEQPHGTKSAVKSTD